MLWCRSFCLCRTHLRAGALQRLPRRESGPTLLRSSRSLGIFRKPKLVDCVRSGVGIWRGFSSQAWVEVPSGAVVEVPLAQTGEGIAECELLKWFIQEGEYVEEFQRLCEVQSDKATIEITSRYTGKVHQILFSPGDIVKVGETLLKVLVEESENSIPESELLDTEVSIGNDSKVHLDSTDNEEKSGTVLCTPSVRHLAKQHGLNINDIFGTGKDGRVLEEDVLNHLDNKRGFGDSLFHTKSRDTISLNKGASYVDTREDISYQDKVVPLRGFHRSMVKSMTMAAKVPHFHYVEEINCNALVQLKAAFQEGNTDPDVKHTYLPFLIKALSMALHEYPLLNSSFKEESTEVIYKGSHNIGIAMATPYGLVVPNIKTVQSLSILEITKELSRLQQMALSNKLSTEDVTDITEDITGGTITLSNIGAVGGKFGSPLLNLPEVSIIAIGRIQRLPRYDNEGVVYPASIANVAIGADHRVVDGATVARFCTEWKRLIEKPELLFLHMR